jgi:hypothetical protein
MHWLNSNCGLQSETIDLLKLWVRIPLRRGAYDTTLCVKVCQWLTTCLLFSPGTLVASINKLTYSWNTLHFLYEVSYIFGKLNISRLKWIYFCLYCQCLCLTQNCFNWRFLFWKLDKKIGVFLPKRSLKITTRYF